MVGGGILKKKGEKSGISWLYFYTYKTGIFFSFFITFSKAVKHYTASGLYSVYVLIESCKCWYKVILVKGL